MKRYTSILVLYLVLCTTGLDGSDYVSREFNKYTYKSPEYARSFALFNVIIPIVPGILSSLMLEDDISRFAGKSLLLYGTFIGPSAGNFYARDFVRGSSGILIRLTAAGYILKIGTLTTLNSAYGGSSSGHDLFLLGSSIAFIGSIGWNILSSSTSASEYNDRYNLSIAPVYDISNKKIGINLSIQF